MNEEMMRIVVDSIFKIPFSASFSPHSNPYDSFPSQKSKESTFRNRHLDFRFQPFVKDNDKYTFSDEREENGAFTTLGLASHSFYFHSGIW